MEYIYLLTHVTVAHWQYFHKISIHFVAPQQMNYQILMTDLEVSGLEQQILWCKRPETCKAIIKNAAEDMNPGEVPMTKRKIHRGWCLIWQHMGHIMDRQYNREIKL